LDSLFSRGLKFDRDFVKTNLPIRRKNNCNSDIVKSGLHLIKLNDDKAFEKKSGWGKMISFASFLDIRTKKRSPAIWRVTKIFCHLIEYENFNGKKSH